MASVCAGRVHTKSAKLNDLLRKWNSFKAHAEYSVTSISELDSDEIQKLIADPYYNPEYKLATLTKWREFTATAVAHVEEQFSDFSPVFPSFQ